MHMPGHKRNPAFVMENPYGIDVTEVEGTDNLHHPEGIILDLMEHMKTCYGTVKTYPLVGGSTCGILAAVSAACKKGEVILMDRGSHRSVYHTCYLLGLQPEYLLPSVDEKSRIATGISPQEVREKLQEIKNRGKSVAAVLVTSPTYEGILSEIRQIADEVHKENAIFIVDEAHGAHLNFMSGREREKTAVLNGADLVIQSLHKTLPALTQTALLHICSERISPETLERYLDIYETSSPSYVLMASIAQCMEYMQNEGKKEMKSYEKRLEWLQEKAKDYKVLKLWSHPQKEPSKLVILTGRTSLSGASLAAILREQHNIEVEMEAADYILAMTTVADGEETFRRFEKALREVDTMLFQNEEDRRKEEKTAVFREKACPPVRISAYDALNCPFEDISVEESVGKIAAAYLMMYPPGVPFLVPGEEITPDIAETIREAKKYNRKLLGLTGERENLIRVCRD